jgi:dTDP-4-dehydrorhamnose reductase
MKILLTGTSGQVGHAIQETLQALSDQCTLLIPARDQMDLSQPELMAKTIRALQPDLIIHPAAYTAVDRAESEPALTHLINAKAVEMMAAEAKRLNIGLVYFSTDYVFDGTKRDAHDKLAPYTESDTPCPINVYGASKLAGETAIRASGCQHLIFRTSWVYSMFGKNFLLTMLKLANERRELRIVNNQFGTPTSARWIAQVVQLIVQQLLGSDHPQNWWQQQQGTYHLTPNGYTTWCDFTKEIMRLAQQNDLLKQAPPHIIGIPASEYPTPARRPVNSCLDNQRLRQQFSIDIPSWQTALAECLHHSCH